MMQVTIHWFGLTIYEFFIIIIIIRCQHYIFSGFPDSIHIRVFAPITLSIPVWLGPSRIHQFYFSCISIRHIKPNLQVSLSLSLFLSHTLSVSLSLSIRIFIHIVQIHLCNLYPQIMFAMFQLSAGTKNFEMKKENTLCFTGICWQLD